LRGSRFSEPQPQARHSNPHSTFRSSTARRRAMVVRRLSVAGSRDPPKPVAIASPGFAPRSVSR
jgi:hypothetical protein